MLKVKTKDIKAFLRADWGKLIGIGTDSDWYVEECEWFDEEFLEKMDDNEKIEIKEEGLICWQGGTPRPENENISTIKLFKAWQKTQTHTTIEISIPKEQEKECKKWLKENIKKFEGKII